ncbi:hypothetical protein [Staphylococcus auricularis]|nr:hypothetical protein [Staphylococcus auricularis]PTH22951.1 hypothetical protein BU608_10885 [Staphylococcus auricularis]
MKKLTTIGSATLAGALLFSGFSATAEAEDKDIGLLDAQKIARPYMDAHDLKPIEDEELTYDEDERPVKNAIAITRTDDNENDVLTYVKRDTGDLYDSDGNLVQKFDPSMLDDKKHSSDENEEESETPQEDETQTDDEEQEGNTHNDEES